MECAYYFDFCRLCLAWCQLVSLGERDVRCIETLGEMMAGPLVVELFLAAAGIAINPPAVIAAILLVASSRRKALAFAGGWVVGLLAVGCIVRVFGDSVEQADGTSVPMLLAKAVVGISLLVLAFTKWQSHRKGSGDNELPGWMSQLYGTSAPRAFIAAAAFAALNPKTIAFIAAGVLAILSASFRAEAEWVVLLVFVLISSLSVTAPVTCTVLSPRRSAGMLAIVERWLVDNSSAVAAAVLLVLGLMLLYYGAQGIVETFRYTSSWQQVPPA